jgi:hypothetical protein
MVAISRRFIATAGLVLVASYALSPVTIRSSTAGEPTLKLIPIVYGYPSQKLIERAKRYEVWLGGCVSDPLNPRWVLLI